MLLSWKARSLGSLNQFSPRDLCAQHDGPGAKTDDPALVDYSERPATPDQQRIEEELARRDLRASRVLHVGVGDSGLAARLTGRCAAIDGITVSAAELRHAQSLALPGYSVYQINKYTPDLVATLKPGYAVLVDNNPASFACCGFHLATLLAHYRWLLAPGGEVLTDQRGLRWTAGDRRWRMTFADLTAAGQRFGLHAVRVTETVYSLRRE